MSELQTFYNKILTQHPVYLNHQFIIRFTGSQLPDDLKSNPEDKTNAGVTYYVKSSEVPAVKIKENDVSFLSQKFAIPGGIQYDGTWNVTMMVTNDLRPYKNLYTWQQQFASLAFDGGAQAGYQKGIPDTYAHVQLLDSKMENILRTFTLVGVFPEKIPDLSMKYENNSSPIEVSFSFTYQYMYDDKVEGEDPLQS